MSINVLCFTAYVVLFGEDTTQIIYFRFGWFFMLGTVF